MCGGEWSFWALMNIMIYTSIWVGNSITAYLGFTVIYTTKDNRGNMSWQLNHVVTQPQSDSIITFLGETALSRAGLCCIYNNHFKCNKQYRHQQKNKQKGITGTPFVFKQHCLIFPFLFPDNNPCPLGVWLANRCRSIFEFNRDKQSLSPLCPFQAQTRKSAARSIITSLAI